MGDLEEKVTHKMMPTKIPNLNCLKEDAKVEEVKKPKTLNRHIKLSYPTQQVATGVMQVSCGELNTVFLANSGEVYICGGNKEGQLCDKNNPSCSESEGEEGDREED